MGAHDYGLWTLALAFLGLMGIADIGIGSATTKFIAEFNEKQDTQRLSETITIAFAISISLAVIFTAMLYFLAPWLTSLFTSPKAQSGEILFIFQICTLGVLPIMLENIGIAIPRGFQDYKVTTILLLVKNISMILCAVWIVSKDGTATQVIMSTVMIAWGLAIISLIVAFHRIKKAGLYITVSSDTLRKLSEFMFFMGITGIGIKIFTLFDRVVVAYTLGLEAAAYYSIATGIANKFTAFGSAATQALFPAFSSWNVKKDRQSIWNKLVSATSLVGIGAIVPGTILLIFSRPLVFWWLGAENGSIVLYPLQILVAVYMIKVITAPSYQAANGLGRPWVTTLTTIIGSLATIGLIIVLGKSFGLIGAIWANIAVWVELSLPVYLYFMLIRRPALAGALKATVTSFLSRPKSQNLSNKYRWYPEHNNPGREQ